MIKFNQKSYLKPHIVTGIEPGEKTKNNFEKYFFKLPNNAVLEKLWRI